MTHAMPTLLRIGAFASAIVALGLGCAGAPASSACADASTDSGIVFLDAGSLFPDYCRVGRVDPSAVQVVKDCVQVTCYCLCSGPLPSAGIDRECCQDCVYRDGGPCP